MRPLSWLLLLCLPVLFAQTAAPGEKDAGPVTEQRKAAFTNWKRAFDKDKPPSSQETAHLLLYGKVPGKTLKQVGVVLEKSFSAATKALALEKRDFWPGKLTVYLVPERADYAAFIRRIERRYPDEGEHGSAAIRRDQPHAVAGPPLGAFDLPLEGEAAAQVGIALLKKKAGETVPEWVRQGFGRATYLQTLPASTRSSERRKVLALVLAKQRKAWDVWGPLDDTEGPLLRGSLMDYLAYSGRTARFLPFVQGFRPSEKRAEPTTADALKAAGITNDGLNRVWRRWLQTSR
jgi:hypothetical protein